MPAAPLPLLRVAALCKSGIVSAALHEQSTTDALPWLREQVESLVAAGASGPLYVFLNYPPDAAMATALRWTAAGRLPPSVIAECGALNTTASLELLRDAAVKALYITLYGANAETHEQHTQVAGSWRHALLLLTKGPRILERIRVDTHLALCRDSVTALPGVLRLLQKVGNSELLLWDVASLQGNDAAEPAIALRALDLALTTAQHLGVRIRPVGFQRTRTISLSAASRPCVASAAMVELLRDGIVLPATGAGLLASDGKGSPFLEAAPSGSDVSQLAFELAARGRPFLDLPPCLGGAPPRTSSDIDRVKFGACRQCPIDAQCPGVPRPLSNAPGVSEEMRPPLHWLPMPPQPRVLVMCTVVSDQLYGATFFSLARELVRLGARVDVVSPWQIHADVSLAFAEEQPPGEPPGGSEVERFINEGSLSEYDLILAPYIKTARQVWTSGRLRHDTRLIATDFHMLGGMYEWARDVCPPGRRPEEGGWWPSENILLSSAFPGYAALYTRYGVPMRQIAWQPFAVDPASFPFVQAVGESNYIVSGGNHRRDLTTLLGAARLLEAGVHPIELFAQDQGFDVPPQIRFRGTVPTSQFCSVVARSRFMVVPLLDDPYNAAGITAIVTALMLGRPIVATASASTRDYIEDGVSGLLVPPSDAGAMAAAIERLDRDPALLERLATGAMQARDKLTTEAWAKALLLGSRQYDQQHWLWTR